MTTKARVKAYRQLLKETAQQLGQAPDAEVVRHVTSFKMLRQSLEAKMLLGQHVDPGDLLKIDEVLKQYLPQGAPISVTLRWVNGTRVCCPQCQHHFDPHTDKPNPPEPPPARPGRPEQAPVLDLTAEPVGHQPPAQKRLPAPASSPANGGIHAQPGARTAPSTRELMGEHYNGVGNDRGLIW